MQNISWTDTFSTDKDINLFAGGKNPDTLKQWFLTFLKSGNTFDYVKNLRNAEIMIENKDKQKTSRVEINIF